jgi:hypothetical protein
MMKLKGIFYNNGENMTTWNPYPEALKWIEALPEEDLQKYIFFRLTGREADPPWDWSRGQEAPEDFLIWAFGDGSSELAKKLSGCLIDMLPGHFAAFMEGRPGEAPVISRLLYLAASIKAVAAAPALHKVLLNRGKICPETAQKLLESGPVPWGESLLHQALDTLGLLEAESEPQERRAKIPFWAPIAQGNMSGFPKNTRLIALRALARLNWKTAVESYLHYYLDILIEDSQKGRRKHSLERKLANIINFFIQLSRPRQEERMFGLQPGLLEDPTPITRGFRGAAHKSGVIPLLEGSLNLLCNSALVFDGDHEMQHRWQEKYRQAIVDEARWPVGSVLARVAVEEAAVEAGDKKKDKKNVDEFAVLGRFREAGEMIRVKPVYSRTAPVRDAA